MKAKIERYYRQTTARGHGTLGATLTLPFGAAAYLRRRLLKGDQIDGYRRYDLPLLAAYSRSGTNWFRYIVENISGKPTPGQVRIYYGYDFILDRAHRAYAVMDRYERVILLLRDYRECLIRHHTRLWQQLLDVELFMETDTVFQKPDWYVKNLIAYDQFSGDKLLVYYEDLLSSPETVIRSVASFLAFEPQRTEAFLANMEAKYAESVSLYTQGGHRSVTSQKPNFRHHAEKHLTPGQQQEFDRYYQSHYPDIWKKYLRRYAVA